jgi:acetamidase/formamidase
MNAAALALGVALACCARLESSDTHRVVAQTYHRTFDARHPVLVRISPGAVVETKTVDSSGRDLEGKRRHPESGNPLTGPFYIEGAEPGDALAIRFRRIRMNRSWGYSSYRLGLAALTPNAIEKLFPAAYKADAALPGRADLVPWDLDLEHQTVRLHEPRSQRISFEFQARPMLGCVGVAPAGGFAPTSGPAGSYGGNMDYNEVREGCTMFLPVYHAGGLLFFGDGHALQGDGEPIGSGVETSMDVEFSVEVRKNAQLSGPRIETGEHIISVGSQPEFSSDLNRGLQMATTDMVRWLTEEYRLEPWASHLLVAFQGRYDVVTVAGSMALKIAKRYLPPRP